VKFSPKFSLCYRALSSSSGELHVRYEVLYDESSRRAYDAASESGLD